MVWAAVAAAQMDGAFEDSGLALPLKQRNLQTKGHPSAGELLVAEIIP